MKTVSQKTKPPSPGTPGPPDHTTITILRFARHTGRVRNRAPPRIGFHSYREKSRSNIFLPMVIIRSLLSGDAYILLANGILRVVVRDFQFSIWDFQFSNGEDYCYE
jgi:hypothetical protein